MHRNDQFHKKCIETNQNAPESEQKNYKFSFRFGKSIELKFQNKQIEIPNYASKSKPLFNGGRLYFHTKAKHSHPTK